MSYVTTNDGVKLYVKDWGAGPAVVMMHGWPLSSDTFDDLALALAAAGRRAIFYDRRGFGRSEQPWGGYDYNTLADDLAAVIDQTAAQNVTLIGFSMGGGEVARYISRHAGPNVAQAVLIASILPFMLKTPDNPDGVDQSVFDGLSQQLRDDRARFWATFFPDFYGMGLVSSPVTQEVVDWSRTIAMQASLKATLDCAHAFATTDFRPDLPAFRVPTLIIHGADDKTVPIDISARKAAAGIAKSRFIEYERAPHGLLASHKRRVIDDVVRFVIAGHD